MQIRTHSPEETEAIGRKIAAKLLPGDIIAYYGDLGAGKTAFTRGLAAGLGVTEQVTSPTYTIVNEYLSGRMPLFHFDMYRLDSADDLFDIGWEDYLARGGVWRRRVERECGRSAFRRDPHHDPQRPGRTRMSAPSQSKEVSGLRILAFESSAKAASVAILQDGALLGEYFQNSGQTHSRTLAENGGRLARQL